MKKYILALVTSLVVILSACSSSTGVLTVQDVWARPAAMGGNGAVYLNIENGTASNDSLLSVSSETAAASEIHMSMAHDNGVMSMEMQDVVEIPARDKVEFKPGGLHVMLVGLNRDLNIGDTITLTLRFQTAGDVTIDVPVQEP